jgi:2-phosphoglycolate phosphatase
MQDETALKRSCSIWTAHSPTPHPISPPRSITPAPRAIYRRCHLKSSDRKPRTARAGIVIRRIRFDALREIFLEHYANNICVHTHLFSGISDLVGELEHRSIPWGIVTNKPHIYTQPLMQALGYAERAACLVSGDTCANAKPHPEPMLQACELIGVSPLHCLYLGDDLRDMQAANAALMRGVIARYGYISADAMLDDWRAHAIIDNPMELLDLIPL